MSDSHDAVRRAHRVGLGLPVYNGERYVRQAIESVLAQDFDDFMLVITDNCSTDGTEAICRGFAESDPRVRYVRNERNLGMAANFARCYELAGGEWFKWVVHDDVLEPRYLSACLAALEKAPDDVVLVYPRTLLIDSEGSILERYDDRMQLSQSQPSARIRHLLHNLRYCHCGLGLIRRNVLADTRLIDGFESSDVVLLVELALRGRFLEQPEFLYRRRVHEESTFRAYTTPEKFAEMMNPANRGRIALPRTRVWAESLRSIAAAPLGAAERARTAALFARHSLRPYLPDIAGEMLRWARLRRSMRGGDGAGGAGAPIAESRQPESEDPRAAARPPRIGIWGHYHGMNLGDDAVVAAIAQNLRRRLDGVELSGFCQNRVDTARRHGMPAYSLRFSSERTASVIETGVVLDADEDGGPPLKRLVRRRLPTVFRALRRGRRLGRTVLDVTIREPRFLARSFRVLRSHDIVVVAGSGPVSDSWQGAWSHPYALLKWAALSRLAGSRFALMSVGAGPIDLRLSQCFLRCTLRLAGYASYRDQGSAEVVRRRLGARNGRVTPDLAFSLDLDGLAEGAAAAGDDGRPIVGLNVIPWFDARYWPDVDERRYRGYVDRMAVFAGWLLENDYDVRFFSSQVQCDPLVQDDVIELLRARGFDTSGARLSASPIATLQDLVTVIRSCNLVVACRFHCVILPYMLGVPALSVAYHEKFWELMAYLGEPDRCVDIETVTPEGLAEAFLLLERDRDAITRRVADRLPQLRAELEAQYGDVTALLPVHRP